MQAQPRPDVIDTPLVYRTYAVIVGLGGIALAVWGKTAVVQVFGSILMAAGCFATALAMIEGSRIAPAKPAVVRWGLI